MLNRKTFPLDDGTYLIVSNNINDIPKGLEVLYSAFLQYINKRNKEEALKLFFAPENERFRNWFFGEPIKDLESSNYLMISAERLGAHFEKVLPSQNQNIIRAFWDTSSKLTALLFGKEVNFGSATKPDNYLISFDTLLDMVFNKGLTSRAFFPPIIWDNNTKLQKWWYGEEVDFGKPGKPEKHIISDEERTKYLGKLEKSHLNHFRQTLLLSLSEVTRTRLGCELNKERKNDKKEKESGQVTNKLKSPRERKRQTSFCIDGLKVKIKNQYSPSKRSKSNSEQKLDSTTQVRRAVDLPVGTPATNSIQNNEMVNSKVSQLIHAWNNRQLAAVYNAGLFNHLNLLASVLTPIQTASTPFCQVEDLPDTLSNNEAVAEVQEELPKTTHLNEVVNNSDTESEDEEEMQVTKPQLEEQYAALFTITENVFPEFAFKNSSKKDEYIVRNHKALLDLISAIKRTNPNYKFVPADKKTAVDLIVKRIYALNDEFGVFLHQNVRAGTYVGTYNGEICTEAKLNKSSRYVYEVIPEDGETHYVDAENEGDIIRLVNHSDDPNCGMYLNSNNELELFTERPIKKGEQLTYYYRSDFFEQYNISPRIYLKSSHDNKAHAEIYQQNKSCYFDHIVSVDKQLCDDLKIAKQSWLIPCVFEFVFEKNNDKLKIFLQNNPKIVDMTAYCIEDNIIADVHSQQELTALMLACYLGDADCIQTLLDYGANANYQMLTNGYTAFSLLVKGKANVATKEKLGARLIEQTNCLNRYDCDNLSPLHYAIIENSEVLVGKILEQAKLPEKFKSTHDFIFSFLSDPKMQHHADLDFCLKNGYFTILKMLLLNLHAYNQTHSFTESIESLIEKNFLFRKETLASIPETLRENFYNILKEPEFKDIPGLAKLLPKNTFNQTVNNHLFFNKRKIKKTSNEMKFSSKENEKITKQL